MQIDLRQKPQQTLIIHMDGQRSLWEVAAANYENLSVEILDILHAATYV